MVNDTEKVVSTQESICKTIEIIGRKLLSDLQFDITETATIVNDTKKADGIYTVKSTSGTAEYEATSSDKTLSKGNVVYVTIPKGDYKEDKIIVGKKTVETEAAQSVVHAFDNLVEMVDNTSLGLKLPSAGLLANNEDPNDENRYYTKILDANVEDKNINGYTRLGIKADFKSFVPEAVSGDYGLHIAIIGTIDNTIEKIEEDYIFDAYLNTDAMFGNPYNFAAPFSQEYVWDISQIKKIKGIKIGFFQSQLKVTDIDGEEKILLDKSFKDKNGTNISTKEDNTGSVLPDNLFVENIQLVFGYDVTEMSNEFVHLYSLQGSQYTGDAADITADNQKEIKLRWVHMDETYGALDIADAAQSVVEASEEDSEAGAADPKSLTKAETLSNIKKNSKIEWFRYKLGAPSATPYSGVYWEKLENDNEFSYILEPDINLANEQLKVIITYPKDSNNHYYSNILVFKNEKDVSGINAGKFLSALTLKCDDDSYGNYFIYDQGRGLLDQSQSKEIKTITAHFDLEKTGDEIDSVLTEAESICWTVPASNTMITPVDNGIDGMTYLSLKENRGAYFTEFIDEEKGTIIRDEFTDKEKQKFIMRIIKQDRIEKWYNTESITEETIPYRAILINEDGSAEGEEIRGSYRITINFSSYGYDADKELKASSPKYTIYNSEDLTKPLRIYDNINKQISIYDYDLSSDDSSLKNKLEYQISPTYSQSNNNNTIQCSIVKDGTKYSTSKELSFGIMGTADTDYTLVLDFDDNKHAIVVGDSSTKYSCTLRLYDQSGKEVKDFTSDRNVIWSLYSGTLGSSNDLEFITGDLDSETNQWIAKNTMEIQLGSNVSVSNPTSIIVIQASVNWGDRTLIAYLPVPLTNNANFNHIKGPTWITYLSDGSISFDNQEYKIVKHDNSIIDSEASIMSNDNKASAYLPDISEKNRLKPLSFYVEQGTTRCAIKLTVSSNSSNSYWINPLMILQNKYPSRGVNQWDGKTLTIDEENGSIYSTMLVAGSKNSQGQFSGVMLGDMAKGSNEESLSKMTGIYGFQDGEMSYAFKEDGRAFIGKSGTGRIEFNGDSGTIYSSNWGINGLSNNTKGMKIDLQNGKIEIKSKDSQGKSTGITIDGSSGSSYPLTIGKNFSVDWNGNLKAENVNLSGVITATEGIIGSWEIQDGILKSTDTNNTVSLDGETGTISGAQLIGGTIKGSNLYFLNSNNADGIHFKGAQDTQYAQDDIGFLGYTYGKSSYGQTSLMGLISYQSTLGVVIEGNGGNIRIGNQNQSDTVYIKAKKIEFLTSDPTDQIGIYARFA